jgi:hypothetical protein
MASPSTRLFLIEVSYFPRSFKPGGLLEDHCNNLGLRDDRLTYSAAASWRAWVMVTVFVVAFAILGSIPGNKTENRFGLPG